MSKKENFSTHNMIPLKLITILIYITGFLSSIILIIFVKFETEGYGGHYRTVINQLLSSWHGVVRNLYFNSVSEWILIKSPDQIQKLSQGERGPSRDQK